LSIDIKLVNAETQKSMKSFQNKICPNCGAVKMKYWEDLDEEQKFLVQRLPKNTEFLSEERKKHRFCARCWFEETQKENLV
jgi:ribosomal protein S27AE